jgi:hypothetical protein
MTAAKQQILNKQLNYNNEERCFLRGLCQGIINGTIFELSQLWDIRQPVRP